MHTLFHLLLLLIPLHFQFLLLISTTQFPLASQGCHQEERKALLNFKSSLEDPVNLLSSWQKGNQNCCDWHGIGCSNVSFHVTKIDLQNIDTTDRGKISPWLFKITHLEYLDLSGNHFYLQNEIPFQFANLTKLAHLDLSNSQISGSLTTQFANLSSLQYLDLSNSNIVLLSMEWVRQLVNLKVLRLSGLDLYEATSSGNNFGEHMSYLSNLRDLDLSSCNILGQIHSSISNLKNLHSLDLSTNNFQGSIPESISNLKNLYSLDLSTNNFQGSIQESIYNLKNLYSLDLSTNKFQGSIPESISHLKNLYSLDLSTNNFQGSIPESISNLKNLHSVDLSRNNLQGSIPESICEIIPLQELRLSHNNLSGSIPSCFTNLRHVSTFDVSGNSIEGIVPLISWINKLNLTQIDLSGNRLTVIIDQDLPLSQFKLESLRLGSCNISGSIPTFICNLTHLEYLELSDNHLTGYIPSCLYTLNYFNYLNALSQPEPPFFRGSQPAGPPPQNNYAIENVLFYGDVALGFIVGFWGLFFGLLLKKEEWWCGYWRFVDAVATRIVRGCRQLIHVCTEMFVG